MKALAVTKIKKRTSIGNGRPSKPKNKQTRRMKKAYIGQGR